MLVEEYNFKLNSSIGECSGRCNTEYQNSIKLWQLIASINTCIYHENFRFTNTISLSVAKQYYDGVIKRQDAISRLKNSGMSIGSASIYLQVYEHLRDNETFTRTLNAESFDYFLDGILKEFGKVILNITKVHTRANCY